MASSDYSGIMPSTLTAAQLDAAISDLAARVASYPAVQDNKTKLLLFRTEKLNRAYSVGLNSRILADPLLASTATVTVS